MIIVDTVNKIVTNILSRHFRETRLRRSRRVARSASKAAGEKQFIIIPQKLSRNCCVIGIQFRHCYIAIGCFGIEQRDGVQICPSETKLPPLFTCFSGRASPTIGRWRSSGGKRKKIARHFGFANDFNAEIAIPRSARGERLLAADFLFTAYPRNFRSLRRISAQRAVRQFSLYAL